MATDRIELPDGTIIELVPVPEEEMDIAPKDAWSGFHDTDKAWRDK